MVDTGALDSDSGNTNSGDPDSPNQGEPPIAGPLGHYANAAIAERSIPRTYAEAINDPIYGAHWKQAISEELTKLQALNTWKAVPLPPGKKAIGYK